MKSKRPARRQIFVLTPEEKKALVFIAIAFVLGLSTMRYRATHPAPARPPTAFEQRAAKGAAARAKRDASQQRRTLRATRPPSADTDDEE